MFRWFKFAQRSTSHRKKTRPSTQLLLEALEDRLAPAIFNVATVADSAVPGSGTLRAAILASDATAGPNTINLTVAGTYKLTLFGSAHDGTNGALQITNQSVTITNTSGGTALIDGGGVDRVFDIEGMVAGGVAFNGVTIQNGLASTNSNAGADVNGSSDDGGGIYSPQTSVTLNNSTVGGNQAFSEGGGVWTDTGNLTLTNSSISGSAES